MKNRTVSATSLGVSEHAISEFCRANQIRELALFGSILRDDYDRERSDVDVLVDFEPEASIGFLALARIQRELSVLFGRHVDIVPKSGLKPLIRDSVLSDAAQLYAN